MYAASIGGQRFVFPDLATVLAKATPLRSGDQLAGVGTASATERVAAQSALAEVPLARFLSEAVIPYETDEVTRLILVRMTPRPSARSRIGGGRVAPAAFASACPPRRNGLFLDVR